MSAERDWDDRMADRAAGSTRGARDDIPSTESPARTATEAGQSSRPLIEDAEADRLRTQWTEVQQNFVDDPRQAMDAAAGLVSTAAERIQAVIHDRIDELNRRWPSDAARESEAETEQLRGLMQRYRDLLDRLLAA